MVHYDDNPSDAYGWSRYFILMLLGFFFAWISLEKLTKDDLSIKNKLISKFNNYQLLAHYNYTKLEWDNFTKQQFKKKKRTYYVTLTIGILILIGVNIFFEKESRKNLIPINILVFLLLILVNYFYFKTIKNNKRGMLNYKNSPDVKIAQCGILINNTYLVSYHNKDGWLDYCYDHEVFGKECIIFKIRRPGGSRHVSQYFELLIPENKRIEKDRVIKIINDLRVYKNNTPYA